MCFLFWPTKILSAQFVEKIKGGGIVASMTELPPFFLSFLGVGLAGRFSTFFFFPRHGPGGCSIFFFFFPWCDTGFSLLFFIFYFLGLTRREYFFKNIFDMIFLF